MPEGHTLHRLARDQGRDLVGTAVSAWSPQGRFTEGAARVDGRRLERAEAFGKHLFHTFESGDVLHVHLGLIGKWQRREGAPVPDPVGEVRLRLGADCVAWDLSGPQTCEVITPEQASVITGLLGPDPLRRGADPSRFVTRVRESNKAIGALLLDQGIVAGIGNVYRAEVLFLDGILPTRPGSSLTEEDAGALWSSMRDQLRAGVRRNRIVTVTPDDAPGPLSRLERADAVYVYKRDGLPCRRCGTLIRSAVVGGRRTWWCPRCQT